jgi:hypothetical protein
MKKKLQNPLPGQVVSLFNVQSSRFNVDELKKVISFF